MRIKCWNCGNVFRATKKGEPDNPALLTAATSRPTNDPQFCECPGCHVVVHVSLGRARLVRDGTNA